MSQLKSDLKNEFDVVIVGSGFGGSVSAMRLAQKGYSVAVLEKGRRFKKGDFAKSNWDLKRYLWFPMLRLFGIQQISLLKGVMVLHGAGVGGGSLVYANTLMEPRDPVYKDPNWPQGFNWKNELAVHYETAKKMLGVTLNESPGVADEALREVGKKMGVGDSYHLTEVGVYFGKAGKEVEDPYFGGEGPKRTGCTSCGGCMVGCRVGAKNTLDQNYLYFAEKSGAKIFPDIEVKKITPSENGYLIECLDYSWFRKPAAFKAKKVILAAGVLGTLKLLFENKFKHQTLPNLSEQLGERVRTNGESLCGVTAFSPLKDYSRGIAIGSAIHIDEFTKIEAVRYPAGSGAMSLLGVPLVNKGKLPRPILLIGKFFDAIVSRLKNGFPKDWAAQSVILLVMQSIDQTMKLKWSRGIFGPKMKGAPTHNKIPSYFPVAQEATKNLADVMQGMPQNVFTEVLLQTPATAHILGGCMMGANINDGVVNHHHEVFNYPGLYVCDGSVIPVNLGVNPSLTITALSERFASHWPLLTSGRDLADLD